MSRCSAEEMHILPRQALPPRKEAITYEADQRHAEVLIRDLFGGERANEVSTPGVSDSAGPREVDDQPIRRGVQQIHQGEHWRSSQGQDVLGARELRHCSE